MNQAEFEQANRDAGRRSTLEDWSLTSDEQNAAGTETPDGGEWKDAAGNGRGIVSVGQGIRYAYRNWCEWEEVTLPDGSVGIYVRAHAPAADRFL